jgi:hypothetical protein
MAAYKQDLTRTFYDQVERMHVLNKAQEFFQFEAAAVSDATAADAVARDRPLLHDDDVERTCCTDCLLAFVALGFYLGVYVLQKRARRTLRTRQAVLRQLACSSSTSLVSCSKTTRYALLLAPMLRPCSCSHFTRTVSRTDGTRAHAFPCVAW